MFTSQPSSPSEVNEGENLTLQWNYTLDGGSSFGFVIDNVTDGGDSPPSLVSRQPGGVATVGSGYEDKFRAAISVRGWNEKTFPVAMSENFSSNYIHIRYIMLPFQQKFL